MPATTDHAWFALLWHGSQGFARIHPTRRWLALSRLHQAALTRRTSADANAARTTLEGGTCWDGIAGVMASQDGWRFELVGSALRLSPFGMTRATNFLVPFADLRGGVGVVHLLRWLRRRVLIAALVVTTVGGCGRPARYRHRGAQASSRLPMATRGSRRSCSSERDGADVTVAPGLRVEAIEIPSTIMALSAARLDRVIAFAYSSYFPLKKSL